MHYSRFKPLYMKTTNKVLLLILDGYGVSDKTEGNAVFHAKTPNIDHIFKTYPNNLLCASGKAVGLPDNIMGNSEVGHLTIGAGRIVLQDLVRINKFIETSKFTDLEPIKNICCTNNNLHLIGLASDGCVHSSIRHLLVLIDHITTQYPKKHLYIHMITDGRDTSIGSAKDFAKKLDQVVEKNKQVFRATVMGRFYAMDRDNRWERTNQALTAITNPSDKYESFFEAVSYAYKNDLTDEFIKPISLENYKGIKKTDEVLFFNFRSDRARQLSYMLTKDVVDPKNFLTMTRYSEDFSFPILFPRISLKNTLGQVIEKADMKQLRIAETEKYAHVTYFFNGGEETQFKGEDRILIPSPKDVSTYDQRPEMSVFEITDALLKNTNSNKYDLIIANFANADMVGHTGNMDATVKSIEKMDQCIGKILTLTKSGYDILLTSDHGNSENMLESNLPVTSHTLNPVPIVLITEKDISKISKGGLSDIAPTILKLMNIKIPDDMNGKPLL